MYNPFTLEGKTIFVTGASSGIGRSVAIECSKMGANVIITGRDVLRLNDTFILLNVNNHNLQIVADLNNDSEVNNLLNSLPELDGIVHCAGITKTRPFTFINRADLFSIMEVNFFVPTLISQHLIKNRKLRNGASIVFISSINGVENAVIGNSMYSASKGAVNGMVKNMAIDLATKKIRVNSVIPGMVETEILSNSVITSEQLSDDMKLYPLKRYGQPKEIAYGVVYLLSDASSWVTGTNLKIDGGKTLL